MLIHGNAEARRGTGHAADLRGTAERYGENQRAMEALGAKIVAGYQNQQQQMPTFDGMLSEESILDLIAYIKSLSPNAEKEKASP